MIHEFPLPESRGGVVAQALDYCVLTDSVGCFEGTVDVGMGDRGEAVK